MALSCSLCWLLSCYHCQEAQIRAEPLFLVKKLMRVVLTSVSNCFYQIIYYQYCYL